MDIYVRVVRRVAFSVSRRIKTHRITKREIHFPNWGRVDSNLLTDYRTGFLIKIFKRQGKHCCPLKRDERQTF